MMACEEEVMTRVALQQTKEGIAQNDFLTQALLK